MVRALFGLLLFIGPRADHAISSFPDRFSNNRRIWERPPGGEAWTSSVGSRSDSVHVGSPGSVHGHREDLVCPESPEASGSRFKSEAVDRRRGHRGSGVGLPVHNAGLDRWPYRGRDVGWQPHHPGRRRPDSWRTLQQPRSGEDGGGGPTRRVPEVARESAESGNSANSRTSVGGRQPVGGGGTRPGWSWDDLVYGYGASPSGLQFNEGVALVRVSRPRGELWPT